MKIKWGIQTWFKLHPQDTRTFYLEVPDDVLNVCETEEERNAIIEFYVKKEFKNNVSFFWVKIE